MRPESRTGGWPCDVELAPGGRLTLHGTARQLFAGLDAGIERLAVEAGAQPMAVPPTIPRHTLERASYFDAFENVAIAATEQGEFLPPAACYHVYPALAGQRLALPRLITTSTECARREARADDDPGRLQHFRMREVVFVGPAAWVSGERDRWMSEALALASSAGLSGRMEPATDTFFGDVGRGRRLIQQMKALKYELRMNVEPAGELAVASFNLHESFFTSRFEITMSDGSPAASGCAAFGLERWTLAVLARRQTPRT